jgi:predicted O-methyltransferase YrrM
LNANWRRLAFALATSFGRKRGWFIPYRYAASAEAPPTYAAIETMFAAAAPAMLRLLEQAESYRDDFMQFGGAPPNPRFEQDWFPRIDLAIAYALTRICAPRRIIEIGSGHSTRGFARAVVDGRLATRITAIDPAPRADLAGLDIVLRREVVQRTPLEVFSELAAGDFLVIDSSHILMPGSDVDLLFNSVLPRLPVGVLVHVHDVFLPDAYPESWAWRSYNEQNALPALLAFGAWRLVWASHFMTTRHANRIAEGSLGRLPLPAGAHESSLWLERRQPGTDPGG